MTDKTLSVRVVAKDDASKVFTALAKAAQAAADELEKAGTDGAKGLEKIEQEAATAGPAVERVGDSAKRAGVDIQAMGAALVTMGAGLAYAGQLAMEREQMIIGLSKAFGDASQEMISFSDTLASELGGLFNDDAILAGERYFATLVNQYGLTIQQTKELMRTTADLAAAAGIGFEDAAQRVTAAVRNETEGAELLGLALNQQAIDRDNLTLTMSNQEAAQFRLNALNQQSAIYMGTASAVAQSSAGDWARLTNQFKDAAQGVGDFIGPYGSMIAGLGAGAVGLAQFAGGFTALASGIKIATAASAAFAATPLGFAVIGVTAAIGIATSKFMEHREEVKAAEEQYRSMAEAAEELSTQIRDLRLEDWKDADWAKTISDKVVGEFDWQEGWLADELMKSFGTGNWFDEMVTAMLPPMQMGEVEGAWKLQAQKIVNSIAPPKDDPFWDAANERFTTAMSDILTLRDVDGINFDAIKGEMDRLFDAFNAADGAISIDQFNAQLESLYKNNLLAAQGFDATTLAVNNLNAAQSTWMDLGSGSIGEMTTEMTELETATLQTAAATRELTLAERERKNTRGEDAKAVADAQDDWWADQRARTEQNDQDKQEQIEAAKELRLALLQEAGAVFAEREALNNKIATVEIINGMRISESVMGIKAAWQDVAAARQEELFGMMQSLSGLDNPLDQWNATSGVTPYSQLAADAIDAGVALDNIYRITVGNTSAFASQVSGIDDWATGLIGVAGEYAAIDDLLANGRITLDEYNAAQEAQISIAESNVAVQEHVQTIQAMQAPLIAESTAALEDQLGVISEMPAQQQLVALSWMDSATAAKALEIATMATAVANGELGASGEAAFTSYLQGIAAVDPAMKALLIDMGLISEGADGTITVNMDGAEGAISDMDRLTSAIVQLLDFLDDGEINGSVSIEGVDDAVSGIERVQNQLLEADGDSAEVRVDGDNNGAIDAISDAVAALLGLDGDNANVTITADDEASGVINSVIGKLAGIPSSVTTTIYSNTVYSGRTVGETPFAMGGIPGFADGGMVPFYAGEGNRPELARFADGGTAIIPYEGFYAAPPMTRIVPNNGNNYGGGATINAPLNIYAPVYGVDDLDEILAQHTHMIADALERNRIGVGAY